MSFDWINTNPCYSRDPFPDIAPSLLNSADIFRYAREGCLVHPFRFEDEFHNPATYTMSFLGTLHSWVQEGKRRRPQTTLIEKGKLIELPANSISYLETEEEFRLPQYIAARFNLHIRHVHQGILLGTGPVVHPGFVGRLLVPLHNLTANSYNIRGGDRLLWVEFTKLTKNRYWLRPTDDVSTPPPSELMQSRNRAKQFDAHTYFENAEILSRGVVSAFKGELHGLQKRAQSAEESANAASRNTKWLTLGAAVGIVSVLAAVFALGAAVVELFQNNSEMAMDIRDRLDRIDRQIDLLMSQSDAPPSYADAEAKPAEELETASGGPTPHGPDSSEGNSAEGSIVGSGAPQEEPLDAR